ncbi:hypothetical protein CV093_06555 [Oceanobacillus sp. 143]|uniref:Uncharacterized protein n=1 Tax=Oceanobacillus zhaokaii TaxID=2052660 RepID=A0A345PEV9_9BACI|nr:hypothetical protein [Oceanobacillus zhaokaii]AXI08539.1 hypothetical protein CUC15_06230 [Oceanobacillus zhaokaii]QGS68361.1 hypothetical protein CV093_06555 [Oceanobacillus sp. 143]
MKQKNIIGRILFYLGIVVIIIGIVHSIVNSYQLDYEMGGYGGEEYKFFWSTFLYLFPSAFLNGLILIGLSEAIRLLDSINRKEPPTIITAGEQVKNNEGIQVVSNDKPEVWEISEAEEEKIYELYADKAILEITPYITKGYCIVKLQDYDGPLKPFVKVLDLNGINPEEVQNLDRRKEIIQWYNN